MALMSMRSAPRATSFALRNPRAGRSGSAISRRTTIHNRPREGFAAHPLIDGQKLICLVGGKDSVAVAFDKSTGKRNLEGALRQGNGLLSAHTHRGRWHKTALDMACRGTEFPRPGKRKGVLDGTVQVPFRAGHRAISRLLGDLLLVSSFYNGSLMMRLDGDRPSATVAWRGSSDSERQTDGLSTH